MSRCEDLTGKKFGRLTAIKKVNEDGPTKWLCSCSCGNHLTTLAASLKSGRTTSCGCFAMEVHKGKYEDLTGQVFGRLTVMRKDDSKKRPHWICLCSCNSQISVSSGHLKSGHTKSCGCYRKDITTLTSTKHGGSETRLYRIWAGMIQRCTDKNNPAYCNYGGRGITVCKEWKESFEKFRDWSIEAEYKEDLTIDRIDVNGNYCPENCRWATKDVQANNARSNVIIEFNGKKQTRSQWAREVGLPYFTLRDRIRSGWSVEEALTTPAGCKRNSTTATELNT